MVAGLTLAGSAGKKKAALREGGLDGNIRRKN